MDVSIGLAGKALDVARTLHQLRRRVRVRVHLSTGKVVKSRKGSPPPVDSVPGKPEP